MAIFSALFWVPLLSKFICLSYLVYILKLQVYCSTKWVWCLKVSHIEGCVRKRQMTSLMIENRPLLITCGNVIGLDYWTPHAHDTLFASVHSWVQAFIKLSDTSEMVQAVKSSCTCNLPYSQHAIYQSSTYHQGGWFNLQDSYLSFCHICVTTAGAAHSAPRAVCLFQPSLPSQPPLVGPGEELHSSIQFHIENSCSKRVMGSGPKWQTSVIF